jgi:hypothetical protein
MPRRAITIEWSRPRARTSRREREMARGEADVEVLPVEPLPEAPPAPASRRASIDRILQEFGTPEVRGAANPREEAIGLLQLAAEVEHALMVQYLYAAASIPRSEAGGADPRSKILSVAQQEMGHLISVQNLLLLIGGPRTFHFGRDTIRSASADNPIPLTLEPLSVAALAKFIVAEMPASVSGDLQERIDRIVEIAEKAGVTPHRVGALYAKLFWLFQPDDQPRAPLELMPTPALGLKPGWHLDPGEFMGAEERARFEATRAQWIRGSAAGFILTTATNAAEARALITAISEQGEGLGEAQDSHFFEFLELLVEVEAGRIAVTPLPTNPVASHPPAPDAGPPAPITTPYARRWAELFDIRYNLLVLDLWQAMATAIGEPARTALIRLAYANMTFVWELTEQLLLIRENAPDAAPPYGLQFDDLPDDAAQRWRRHAQLLADQTATIAAIRASPAFQDCSSGECEILDFNGQILLANIEENDASRRMLLPPEPIPSPLDTTP